MTAVDVAVIGRGMIGSAAARHLAEGGLDVALIGPGEPEDRRSSAGPFSSHPDEGRITRIAGRTDVWSTLAARSIARYADIEQRSGHRFHYASGLAVATDDIETWIDNGLIMGSDIRKVDAEWLQSATGIALGDDQHIGYEGPPAGYINPRQLVEAQSVLAEHAGASVVREPAARLARVGEVFEASGPWGAIRSQRVLLATGAFGADLLDVELDVERRLRTVVRAETDTQLPLPSLIMKGPPDPRLQGIYWVPPVLYPDERRCLKIGGDLFEDRSVDDPAALIDWFHSDGYQVEVEALTAVVQALLPDVAFHSFSSDPCVITATPSDHPFIGFVDSDVAVAIGGNGSAAKSSDEIGRLAATLFSDDGWTDSLAHQVFAPQLR